MPRWLGLLGSWALLVLGLGLFTVAAAAEWINVREAQRFRRVRTIDAMLEKQNEQMIGRLRSTAQQRAEQVGSLESEVRSAEKLSQDLRDSERVIVVSTAENKVWVRENGKVVFESICSTGKGTTLIHEGRAMTFDTPIGKFRIISKEENPTWVPPDWHFVEEAKKRGMRVVRLGRGDSLDADSGGAPRSARDEGVWGWMGSSGGSNAVIKVEGENVVEVRNGQKRALPAGELITAGNTVVIPPIGTQQRKYDKVLGTHRLNLGDGYALHGTMAVSQLGRSVSHGCVRLANEDIARLYQIAEVGDEVIIY